MKKVKDNRIVAKTPCCGVRFLRTREQLAAGEICTICNPANKPGPVVKLIEVDVKAQPQKRSADKTKR